MKIDFDLHGFDRKLSEIIKISERIGMGKYINTKIEKLEQAITKKLYESMEPLMDSYVKRLCVILTLEERHLVSSYLESLVREELGDHDYLQESDDPEIQEILMRINADEEAKQIYEELHPFMVLSGNINVSVDM